MSAKYPTSAAGDSDLFIAVNNKVTNLTAGISPSDLTIPVTSTTGFPSVGYISIDNEIIHYTSVGASQFNADVRGADGSTAASHLSTTQVSHNIVADHHNTVKEEIKAIENDLVAAFGSVTPAGPNASDTSILNRIKSITQQIKNVAGISNWYDSISKNLTQLLALDGSRQMTGTLDMNNNALSNVSNLNNSFIGGRNRIINGAMQIDQRNAGNAVTINSLTGGFSSDRWKGVGQSTDGVFTLQRNSSSVVSGFAYSLKATVTTADASIGASQQYKITHVIESNNVRDLQWGTANAKTVTLSFWVKSSVTGTFSGALQNDAGTQGYPFTFVINSANTWEYKTITIAGSTTGVWENYANAGIYIFFDLGSGSTYRDTAGSWRSSSTVGATGAVSLISTLNATYEITGVQFEVGSVATPFEQRSIQQELILCQRYYEKSYPLEVAVGTSDSNITVCTGVQVVSSSQARCSHQPFKVTKRVSPTMYIWSQTGTANQWTWANGTGSNSAFTTGTPNVTQQAFNVRNTNDGTYLYAEGHWAAEAEL